MWTAFSSVFALLMGYSRVPYAAALDGNYFRIFAHLHPRRNFPDFSLLALGLVATVFCFFSAGAGIAALVVIRIVLQYLLQQIGVIVLRVSRAGSAAAIPHLAVSAAAAPGAGGISVHPVLAPAGPARICSTPLGDCAARHRRYT